MMSSITVWFTGSRPENGSSRITNSGSCAMAARTWTFWPMPFDSASVLASAKSLRPYRSRSSKARALAARWPMPFSVAK